MTIVDIAKESGYSVSTVSRVLNNRKDVSPEAKRRIMEIVESHNFVPNNNAKHLKQNVTKNILVVLKGTSNMLFANIVEEIQKIVGQSDYAVGVYYLDEDDNEVEEYPDWQANNDNFFNRLSDSVVNLLAADPARTDWRRIKA